MNAALLGAGILVILVAVVFARWPGRRSVVGGRPDSRPVDPTSADYAAGTFFADFSPAPHNSSDSGSGNAGSDGNDGCADGGGDSGGGCDAGGGDGGGGGGGD